MSFRAVKAQGVLLVRAVLAVFKDYRRLPPQGQPLPLPQPQLQLITVSEAFSGALFMHPQ